MKQLVQNVLAKRYAKKAIAKITVSSRGPHAVLLVAFGFFLDVKILKEQLHNPYLMLSRTLANNMRILHNPNPDEIQSLVGKLGFSNGCRATLIAHEGVVVGDSGVAENFVKEMDNHGGPEFIRAIATGAGHSDRFSATLALELHHTGVRSDWNRQVMELRRAKPLSDYYQALWAQRKLLLGFGAVFLILLIIIRVQAAQFMAHRLKRERALLEHRFEVRTGEVTQLQNLGTILSACESHQEAWLAI
ncbi:MAG: hypothetical protein JXK94_03095 [Deltaproteobacteria bacterium]|nr:hypothetical protein [Deltaproteobacteria bacterium]